MSALRDSGVLRNITAPGCSFDAGVVIDGREVDFARNTVTWQNESVHVPQQWLALTKALAVSAPRICSREELIDKIWAGNYLVGERGLTNAIYRLRRVLREEPAQSIIRTVHRRGYHLAATATVEFLPVERARFVARQGDWVPNRRGWRLAEQLEKAATYEVWRVDREENGESRLFKFTCDLTVRSRFEDQARILKVLKQELGRRDDLPTLIGSNFQTAPYYLELEFEPGIDLNRWARASGGMARVALNDRVALFHDLVRAVAAMHRAGVSHGDIRPENVVVCGASSPRVQLRNLGARQAWTEPAEGVELLVQSRLVHDIYRAPETIAGRPASERSDVYALGMMLYQFLVGDFRALPTPGWQRRIESPGSQELITSCLDPDPKRRPDSGQICSAVSGQRRTCGTAEVPQTLSVWRNLGGRLLNLRSD